MLPESTGTDILKLSFIQNIVSPKIVMDIAAVGCFTLTLNPRIAMAFRGQKLSLAVAVKV